MEEELAKIKKALSLRNITIKELGLTIKELNLTIKELKSKPKEIRIEFEEEIKRLKQDKKQGKLNHDFDMKKNALEKKEAVQKVKESQDKLIKRLNEKIEETEYKLSANSRLDISGYGFIATEHFRGNVEFIDETYDHIIYMFNDKRYGVNKKDISLIYEHEADE